MAGRDGAGSSTVPPAGGAGPGRAAPRTLTCAPLTTTPAMAGENRTGGRLQRSFRSRRRLGARPGRLWRQSADGGGSAARPRQGAVAAQGLPPRPRPCRHGAGSGAPRGAGGRGQVTPLRAGRARGPLALHLFIFQFVWKTSLEPPQIPLKALFPGILVAN